MSNYWLDLENIVVHQADAHKNDYADVPVENVPVIGTQTYVGDIEEYYQKLLLNRNAVFFPTTADFIRNAVAGMIGQGISEGYITSGNWRSVCERINTIHGTSERAGE